MSAATEPGPGPRPATGAFSDIAREEVRSFAIIAAIFVALLLISLGASWAALEIVNATRAYATGEGRYSKAQKIAVLYLHRYAYSGEPGDYADFIRATSVPRGDRVARLALEAEKPDLAIATQGFLDGENHADDIDGIIFLFQ